MINQFRPKGLIDAQYKHAAPRFVLWITLKYTTQVCMKAHCTTSVYFPFILQIKGC